MRTNEEIYTDIMDKLDFEPSLDNSNIAIAVKDGVVMLSGTVNNLLEKRIAERAVKSIADVKAIANELEVNIAAKFQHSDAELASAAVNALQWDVAVPEEHIQVAVEEGRVTLTGTVDWWYQRNNAEKTIRRLTGVKSVNNQIVIKQPKIEAKVKNVKTQIMREFQRNAAIDANNIEVTLEDSKIILNGTVRSWAESYEAARGAWSVPGITEVENHLSISP